MKLTALYVRNFRNFSEAGLEFSPGINAICGPNALGKTTLLEAIHLLITGRSFRTAHLSDLIQFGKEAFYIEGHFETNGVEQVLKMTSDGQTRTIIHNATPLPTVSSLLGLLLGVILSPEDTSLIKGSPASRRQFLDLQNAQANPLYLHHLSRYHRAMKQRNHLLRQRSTHAIEVWEEEMARSADYITHKRAETTARLEIQGHPLQKMLSGDVDRLGLRYGPSALSADSVYAYYLAKFAQLRERELTVGKTLSGPHRDDLTILLDGREARAFASEGQQRSAAAALRLAQWEHLRIQTKQIPLMCIDDVGMGLDDERQAHLTAQLATLGQVFLTSPRKDLPLPPQALVIPVAEILDQKEEKSLLPL